MPGPREFTMSAVDATAPHRRLAAFYFAYFLAMGALVPYWSLYLQDRGLEPQAIGALVALMTLIKVISPNFWGAIADSRGWHLGVIRVSLCVACSVVRSDFDTRRFLVGGAGDGDLQLLLARGIAAVRGTHLVSP